MTLSELRRYGIYFAGGFCILVLTVLVLKALFSSSETDLDVSGPECLSTTFGVRISEDDYLEGGVTTNCETGADVLLSYHLFDEHGETLDFEGIRFPSVTVGEMQVGFFRIPLNSLKYLRANPVDIRFDWVREGFYWFTDRYSFKGDHTYRFSGSSRQLDLVETREAECRMTPANFRTGQLITYFEQLTGVGGFRVLTNCALPENAFLTYHLLDAEGMVLHWDVADAEQWLVCTDSFDRDVARIAYSIDIDEAAFPLSRDDVLAAAASLQGGVRLPHCGRMEDHAGRFADDGSALAAVNNPVIWRNDEHLSRIVIDSMTPGADGVSGVQVAPVSIGVDAKLDRIKTLASLIPRLLPADDYVLVPALVKVKREAQTGTPFRVSMEVFDSATHSRYETDRSALSSDPQNVYQFRKISFRAPPEGVWNLKVGYVFDPYMWHSVVFPADADRVVFINPMVFMLLVLLSLYVFRGLIRFFKDDRAWYGKVLTVGAMLGLASVLTVSAFVTIAGFSALVVYTMLKLGRSRDRFGDPWLYYILFAFSFGLLMEAFWSVHYADVYRHGVVLSACLHALIAVIILALTRRDTARRIALAAWFVFSGTLYIVVVSYLKFFGEPPRYSVYQYAGQAIDVADSALVLLSQREWLGVGLILFTVVLVLVTRSKKANWSQP